MTKNYFFLFRLVQELNTILTETSLTDAFCQEKDKLVLEFTGNDGSKYLEIQVSQKDPYILFRQDYSIARKNVVHFFQDYLPLKIDEIGLASLERTIYLNSGTGTLAFILHGAHTNVCLTANNTILGAFKSVDENDKQILLSRSASIQPANLLSILESVSALGVDDTTGIKRKYPFLGNEILDELFFRNGKSNQSPGELLQLIIWEVLEKDLVVGIDTKSKKLSLFPASFNRTIESELLHTSSAIKAVREYIYLSSKTDSTGDTFKNITTDLKKRIANLEVRKEKLQGIINDETRVPELRKTGDLLAANIYKLDKGMDRVEVEDYTDGDQIRIIELQEKLTPQQNIDVFFKKARSVEQSIERSREELPKIEQQLERLKARYTEIQQMDHGQLKDLAKMIESQDKKNNKNVEQVKTIKFIIDGKYTLLVGKDSRNNDLLTLHVAKQEDIWMHARSVPGSHVIIQVANSKEEIQKSVIKKAAAVAAFYSKAKNAGLVPVSYTKKKYVSKRKGSPAGQVMLSREETVMVKPGIPEGVEIQKDTGLEWALDG